MNKLEILCSNLKLFCLDCVASGYLSRKEDPVTLSHVPVVRTAHPHKISYSLTYPFFFPPSLPFPYPFPFSFPLPLFLLSHPFSHLFLLLSCPFASIPSFLLRRSSPPLRFFLLLLPFSPSFPPLLSPFFTISSFVLFPVFGLLLYELKSVAPAPITLHSQVCFYYFEYTAHFLPSTSINQAGIVLKGTFLHSEFGRC